MKFGLVDRILEIEPGQRIVAVKAVSLAEEYLQDHFPTFPVLPGVFMLEALVESAGWLVRRTRDFDVSVILLQQAKNVTYKSFVKPGNVLRLEVNCRRIDQDGSDFTGIGHCNERETVRARFSLRHLLCGSGTEVSEVDRRMMQETRARFALLYR